MIKNKMRFYSLTLLLSLPLSLSAFAMIDDDESSVHTTTHTHNPTIQTQDQNGSSSNSPNSSNFSSSSTATAPAAAAAAVVSLGNEEHPGGLWKRFPSSEQLWSASDVRLWMIRCRACKTWLRSTQTWRKSKPFKTTMLPTDPMIRRHILLDCKRKPNASSGRNSKQGQKCGGAPAAKESAGSRSSLSVAAVSAPKKAAPAKSKK